MDLTSSFARARARTADEIAAFQICRRAGFVGGLSPRQALLTLRVFRRFGSTAGVISAAAIRHGDRVGLIDDLGELTYSEMDRRSNALARSWQRRGVTARSVVAILARNHRYFFDAFFAAQKLGCRTVLLNTDFAGPQLKDVAERERLDLLVHDDEFAERLADLDAPLGTVRAFSDAHDCIQNEILGNDDRPLSAPEKHGSLVILTSGTTGRPKGATRSGVATLTPIAALLDAVPLQAGRPNLIAPPVFHSLGFGSSVISISMGMPIILRRSFRPDQLLDDIADHRPASMFIVPIMLVRLLDAHDRRGQDTDFSSLRAVVCAGSQLGGSLATRALDTVGETIYNLYGSTEVAFATIARPQDLREAPETVGPPTWGARLRIVDEDGRDVPQGTVGRIVVGNAMPFEGYTGGGSKALVDGLMASGDVGHVDEQGRLFIDGRDDAMIVSGGENVFPDEVEEHLRTHPAVADVAVTGVADEEWGQRLRAFVVLREGHEVTSEMLQRHVRDHLARFKVPRDVLFVETLPRTPTGKVLKRALAELDPNSPTSQEAA